MMRVVRFLFWLSKIMKYLENLDNLSLLYLFGIIICFFICVYFRTLSKEKRGNYYHITPRWLW